MNTGIFNDMITLVEHCQELSRQLATAREELTDEQWDEMQDGPFGEILCAAMDVEAQLDDM